MLCLVSLAPRAPRAQASHAVPHAAPGAKPLGGHLSSTGRRRGAGEGGCRVHQPRAQLSSRWRPAVCREAAHCVGPAARAAQPPRGEPRPPRGSLATWDLPWVPRLPPEPSPSPRCRAGPLLNFSSWNRPQLSLLSHPYPRRPLSLTKSLLGDPKLFPYPGSTFAAQDSVLWSSQAGRGDGITSKALPWCSIPALFSSLVWARTTTNKAFVCVCGGVGGCVQLHNTQQGLRVCVCVCSAP